MIKYNSNILIISIISLLVIFSGCTNSGETTQNNQSASQEIPTTPTNSSVPVRTVKIIDLHAQQLVLDVNEIKIVLGRDWKTSGGSSVMDVSKLTPKLDPKNMVNTIYESSRLNRTGGSIQYYAMVQLMVFSTINEAKLANEEEINIGEANPSITNISGYRVQTSDGNIILNSVRNNVVTYVWISRVHWPRDDGQEFLSKTDKTEMLGIDKAINLANAQDAKISKILVMIQ